MLFYVIAETAITRQLIRVVDLILLLTEEYV